MAQTLDRKVPVRAAYVVVALIVFVFTLVMEANYPEVHAQDYSKWFLGVIGVAILGDSWRPSGRASAFPVPGIVKEGEET